MKHVSLISALIIAIGAEVVSLDSAHAQGPHYTFRASLDLKKLHKDVGLVQVICYVCKAAPCEATGANQIGVGYVNLNTNGKIDVQRKDLSVPVTIKGADPRDATAYSCRMKIGKATGKGLLEPPKSGSSQKHAAEKPGSKTIARLQGAIRHAQ